MSRPTVTQNDQKLQKLVGQDQAEALINVVDPFHDENVDPTPLPTLDGESVVAQMLTHSKTISAPPGTAGNWSCIIFTTPLDVATTMNLVRGTYNGSTNVAIANPAGGASYAFPTQMTGYQASNGSLFVGPVSVWSYNTDISELVMGPGGQWTTTPAAHWADTVLSAADSSVSYRVTGGGIEIHNTTAEIYKQGTLTVCRTTNRKQEVQHVWNGIEVTTGNSVIDNGFANAWSGIAPVDYTVFQLPPANLEDALLQGARQWPAAEGVMSVSVVDNNHNHFTSYAPRLYALDTNLFLNPAVPASSIIPLGPASVTGLAHKAFIGSATGAPSGGFNWLHGTPFSDQNHETPRDIVAIYLTGLSQQSTFTLTTKYSVEIKPRIFDAAYSITVPMRKSPPLYRPHTELVEAHMLHELPPGVPVSMNPSGEAWADIISGLGDLASILGPLAGPVGAFVGSGAKAASRIASKMIRSKSSKQENNNNKGTAQKTASKTSKVKK